MFVSDISGPHRAARFVAIACLTTALWIAAAAAPAGAASACRAACDKYEGSQAEIDFADSQVRHFTKKFNEAKTEKDRKKYAGLLDKVQRQKEAAKKAKDNALVECRDGIERATPKAKRNETKTCKACVLDAKNYDNANQSYRQAVAGRKTATECTRMKEILKPYHDKERGAEKELKINSGALEACEKRHCVN